MKSNMGGQPRRGWTAKLRSGLRRGAADQSGAAAVFFAISLLLLAPLTLGLIDVYVATTQRGQLQDALDAATLYVGRSKETDPDKLKAMGYGVLQANLQLSSGQTITSYDFKLVDGRTVVSSAAISPPSFAPGFFTQNNLQASSEVTRNSNNLEVALVVDTTGSMSAQMSNLRTAAKDLVDLVVQDQQTPYYSKVALIPYSAAVNVDTFADQVRGPLRQPTAITGITRASPAVVSSTNHGLQNGEKVYISGVSGVKKNDGTVLNGKEFTVANRTADTFQLKDTDTSGWSKYNSGGRAFCVAEGCQLFSFTNAEDDTRRRWGRNCATERTGTEAYTDAGPGTALVGRFYAGGESSDPPSNMGCNSEPIMPLSSSKTSLKTRIDEMQADGYTAGHIGLAWGWYAVSPAWNTVFTGTSAPASYDKPETIKVVILMTDGEFNTTYCKGVSSKDGSGSASDRINCNATNGNAYTQAANLCANMKAKNVVLYTVGFNIGNSTNVTNLLKNCATSPKHVFLPSSGTALKDAFKAIGQDINRLRISK